MSGYQRQVPSYRNNKSSVGIGILLFRGDRRHYQISLTADPLKRSGSIRHTGELRNKEKGAEITSCPTCGRCNNDLRGLAKKLNQN